MPGRRAQRPGVSVALSTYQVNDPATARVITQIEQAVGRLQERRERVEVTTDLLIGRNVIRHGLGRPCLGYTITPTFLTIAFGHAIDTDNPNPELEIWIDVVGSDQFGARVEIY